MPDEAADPEAPERTRGPAATDRTGESGAAGRAAEPGDGTSGAPAEPDPSGPTPSPAGGEPAAIDLLLPVGSGEAHPAPAEEPLETTARRDLAGTDGVPEAGAASGDTAPSVLDAEAAPGAGTPVATPLHREDPPTRRESETVTAVEASLSRPVAGSAEPAPVRLPPRAEAPAPVLPTAYEAVAIPVRILAREGGGEARIQLSPPELGRVELTVLVEDGKVRARLEPERADVAQLLVRHVPELRDSLGALGLAVEEIFVGSGESRERDGGTGAGRGDPASRLDGAGSGEDEVGPARFIRQYVGPDGVDVWA